MLDSIQILSEARQLGSTKTLADVDALLATYNYPTLRTQEKANYRVEIWDKVTPINGIDPQVILADVPASGEVYLIYINGNLVFLQKHDPEQVGYVAMDATTAMAKANKIVDQLVEQAVDARVRQEVLRSMLTP